MAALVQRTPLRSSMPKTLLSKFGLHAATVLALLPLSGCVIQPPPKGLKTANNFDARRFQGTWHEILRYNCPDEAGLTRVTATYSKQGNGTWVVTDRAWKNTAGQWVGSTSEIRDPEKTQGTLLLKYRKPRHVIFIDNDHTLALVCGPNAQHFSIISKSLLPDSARLERIMAQAEDAGFPMREAFWVPTK